LFNHSHSHHHGTPTDVLNDWTSLHSKLACLGRVSFSGTIPTFVLRTRPIFLLRLGLAGSSERSITFVLNWLLEESWGPQVSTLHICTSYCNHIHVYIIVPASNRRDKRIRRFSLDGNAIRRINISCHPGNTSESRHQVVELDRHTLGGYNRNSTHLQKHRRYIHVSTHWYEIYPHSLCIPVVQDAVANLLGGGFFLFGIVLK
jgi:hypothetical protein